MTGRIRAVLAGGVAVVAAVAGFAAPAAAAAEPVDYVALGDSYSAGLGARSYDPASGDCSRSSNAYPAMWAAANAPATFAFVACSGATTSDVRSEQLSALTDATDLVTLTVGGNDVGFAPILATCVIGTDAACDGGLDTAAFLIDTWLPGALAGLYADISAAAPGASVVVVGYPRLFDPAARSIGKLEPDEQRRMNELAERLNDRTEAAATQAGFRFVSVEDSFATHGVGAPEPWVIGLTLRLNESFHPNAAGQSQGYLPVLQTVTDGSLAG
ncbi:MAG: SGNH/GDSL hydrolase family protein [Kineosporiaceae bacterium]